MSAIEKLQIRGIRSFSPNRDETIEFYSPLTMIVGANGCGKTTIIECLKMACTGVLPPTCKNGQSFVNDPGMTDSTEVKAHIKLRFINRAGMPSVVVRLFQITKKRTKLEFKSLDGTVRVVDEKGNKETLSYKCSDLDKHVPDMLGVSAAIMESVVFCHQEESTWPLSEGAILKKKFDDIFDSSRYAKALDAITKSKKEYTAKSKDLKVEVHELGAHLTAASATREELVDKQEKVDECQHEVQDILVKTEAINEKLGVVEKRIQVAQKTQQDLRELQRNSEESDRRVADRLSSLEQEFSESDEQLQSLLAGFDGQVNVRRQEMNRLRQQEMSVQNSVKVARDKEGVLNTRLGEGFAVEQQFVKDAERESKSMQEIARQLNMAPPPPLPSPPVSVSMSERTGRVDAFLSELDRLKTTCEHDGQRNISSVQKLLDTASAEFRGASTSLQQLQLEVSNDEKELYKLNREKTQCRTELANCDSSASQRAARPEAEADLNQARTQWQEFETTYRQKSEQLAKDRRSVDSEIRELTDRIAADNRLHQDMSLHRTESERLDAQRRQADADLSSCKASAQNASNKYRALIARHVASTGSTMNVDSLCAFSTCQDVETVSRFLSAEAMPQLTHRINRLTGELQTVQRDEAQLQAKKDLDIQRRTHVEASLEQLRQAEGQVKEQLIRLAELRRECDLDEANMSVEDAEAVKAAIKQTEECAAEEEMALRSSKAWRDVVMKKSRDSVPTARGSTAFVRRCPCCDKGLTAEETTVFERSVEKLFKGHKATAEIIASVKSRVDRARGIFKEVSDCFVKITGFGPQRRELQELEARVSDVVSRSKQLADRAQQLTAELESANKDKNDLTVCVIELGRLQSDWTGHSLRLNDVENKLKSLTRGFSSDPNDRRTLGDIEEAQRQREVDREDLQRRKDRLMDEDSRLTKQWHALKAGLAEREKALLEVEQRVARVTTLEEKIRSIEASERSVTTSKESKALELAQLKRVVGDKEAVEKAAKEELRKAEDKHRQALTRILNFRNDLVRTSSDCTSVHSRLLAIDIPSVKNSLEVLQREMKSRQREVEDLQPALRLLEDQLTQEERTKKIVLDNIAYRSCKREAETLQQKLLEARERLGPNAERDHRDAQRDLQKWTTELQRLEKDKHTSEGRRSALEEQILELKKKLKTPLYKDIDKRHRLKNIEYETTLVAVNDLDCYYQALDSALQKFHTIRIDEINKIIRELWQLVYRGGDIECIELVSGAEEGAAKTTRSYNYRVVMRKGDTPLDMRGRCSAGQRVIASVVIRLALAETFCVSCGMLALDEPTTNLDEAHKAGLAHALSRIIASRSKQHNFQLIVITHDEDFVRMMNMELSAMTDFGMPEHYFRICRQEDVNGKYFSHIERIPWDDL